MKKFILAIALLGASVLSFGQTPTPKNDPGFKAQSVSYSITDSSFGLTYVNDGVNSLAGIKILAVSNLFNMPKLSLNGLVVSDFKTGNNLYTGALVDYRLYDAKGFKLDVGVGAKGLNASTLLSHFNLSELSFDKRQFVWSIGFTIPIGSKN